MKNTILFTAILLLNFTSFAQKKTGKDKSSKNNTEAPKYEILENEVTDINYIGGGAGIRGSLNGYNGGAGFGLHANAIIKSRVMLNANFSPYLLDRLMVTGETSDKEGDVFSKYQTQFANDFTISGVINLANIQKEENHDMIVKSERTGYKEITNYYIPVPADFIVMHGIKLGYSSGLTLMDLGEKDVSAHDLSGATINMTSIENASTMYSYSNFRLGYSLSTHYSLEIDVEGYGKKKEHSIKNFYVDALIPITRNFENVYQVTNTAGAMYDKEYVISSNNATLPVGLCIGGYYISNFGKGMGLAFNYEIGALPSYTALLRNSWYINFGINLNFGKKI